MGNPFYTAGITYFISRLVEWYNNLEHMPFKDELETPAEAYTYQLTHKLSDPDLMNTPLEIRPS